MYYMNLTIRPSRLISEIQAEFTKMFPYLKIEFFKNKSGKRLDYSVNNMIRHSQKLADGQVQPVDGLIDIEPEMTVKELENHFQNEFSLAVQVFRRSGNVWLETTMTDNWTLKHQNDHGKELSSDRKKEQNPDFDLSRGED